MNNSNLSIFNFESNEVRVLYINHEPVFCLVDILFAYKSATDPDDALKSISDYLGDEFIFRVNYPELKLKKEEQIFISEPAVTFLLSRSRTKLGKSLTRWIHNEILPTLRKIGLFNSCPFKLSDDSSLVRFEEDDYWTTSTTIAEIFGKEHNNVLRDLEQAQKDAIKFEGMSESLPNFKMIHSTYLDKYGRTTKCYRINRALFNYVVLSYQGDNAKLYRMMFIKAFEELELKVKVFLTQQIVFKNPKRQQVYVLKNTVSGMIKVGITNDLNRRLSELQNASGCEISVEYLAPKSDNAKEIETIIHKHFADRRGIGEWFDIDSKTIIEFLHDQNLTITPVPLPSTLLANINK